MTAIKANHTAQTHWRNPILLSFQKLILYIDDYHVLLGMFNNLATRKKRLLYV